jgi:hypothetical protein
MLDCLRDEDDPDVWTQPTKPLLIKAVCYIKETYLSSAGPQGTVNA